MHHIKCDKCGSTRVEQVIKDPPPKPEPVGMKEFAEGATAMQAVPAVMVYTTWILRCMDCGYGYEFTSA